MARDRSATRILLIGLVLSVTAGVARTEPSDRKPLMVFVLAGQSNMQGKGSIEHLDELVADQPAEYGHLKRDGQWI